MSTPASPTISMYAPDGTFGEVPYEKMHDALQAGGKIAVKMTAPDGTPGYVPADKLPEAVKAGGKVVPFDVAGPQAPQEGFLKAAGSTLSGFFHPSAVSPYPGVDVGAKLDAAQQAQAQDEARKSAGYPLPYRIAAPVAQAVGADVPGMERAAAAGDTSGVLGHAAGSAAPIVLAEAAHQAAPHIAEAIPSTERAGAALQEIKGAAGDVPIDMTKPGNTALELYTQSQRGATLPKVVRDFVQRATKPDSEPITYAEAKDFQSNVSRLSANEKMNLNPNTQRLLGQLNADLKDSLQSAADTAGKGQKFAQAMKEYHDAMSIQGFSDAAKAEALKWSMRAIGGYGIYKLLGIGSSTH